MFRYVQHMFRKLQTAAFHDSRKKFILRFLFIGAFFVLSYYITYHSMGYDRSLHHNIINVGMTCFIALLMLYAGKWFSLVFTPLLTVLIIFNIYLCIHFNIVSFDMLLAIGGTNTHEAYSILKSIPTYNFLLLVITVLIVESFIYYIATFNIYITSLSIICIVGYSFAVSRHIDFSSLAAKKADPLVSSRNLSSEFYRDFEGFVGNTLTVANFMLFPPSPHIIPHQKTDESIVGKTKEKEKNIILIIGESDLASRHPLYGAKDQNVTPHQVDMYKNGQLCFIKQAHSTANQTANSVPMIVSFRDPENSEKLVNEKNLVELAREMGYATSWISSQEGSGPADVHYGYISEFSDFLVRGDYNSSKFGVIPLRDNSLLPIINKQIQQRKPQQFIVVHLTGSHQMYKDTYDNEDKGALPSPHDDYDRSIHKTDKIIYYIDSLAKKYLNHYALLYTSDHGEIVNVGHAISTGGYEQYPVPLLIAGENHAKWCNKAEGLRSKYGYYSEVMDKYLLLEMMGYIIKPETIRAEKAKDNVLNSDERIYDYQDIPDPRRKR